MILDAPLALGILGLAAWAVLAREAFAACTGFLAMGLLLALAWARLGAVDIALTEAAIGAGIGGVLLVDAATRLGGTAEEAPAAPWQRRAIALLCAGLAALLAAALLTLPDPAPRAPLPDTGLGNPVTAVLMAWRGLDTLLEAIVLLLAVLGTWALAPDGASRVATPPRAEGPLLLLARVLPPIGIVIGLHIVWTGADAPGGKFQGAAILAAMWVLAWMAGLARAPAVTDRRLAWALVIGPLTFLAVGVLGLVLAGDFLALPEGYTKPVILLVEAPLTLSIAAGLALLLLGPPERAP